MEIVTKTLQDDIKTIVSKFCAMRNEGKGLYDLYWKGSVNTDLGGTGSDPASVTSGLTKQELLNFQTMVTNLDNFWENVAVSQSDYQVTIQACLHGDAVLATALSSDTEDYADRSVVFCQDLLTQYDLSREVDNLYLNSEISAAVAGISSQTVVFGAGMTKDDLTSAINLIREFIDFIENAAITTADYKATLAKWRRL